MKLRAIEQIFRLAVVWTIPLCASPAFGQYYDSRANDSNVAGPNRLPLNQLPPIVSSEQAQQQKSMLQPQTPKGLFIPQGVGNLPPIVSPATQQQPFIVSPNQSAPASQPPGVPLGEQPQPTQRYLPPLPPQNATSSTLPVYSRGGVPLYNDRPASTRDAGTMFDPNASPFESQVQQSPFTNSAGTRSMPPIVTSPRPSNLPPVQDYNSSLSPGELSQAPIESEISNSVVESAPIEPASVAPVAPVQSGPGANDYFNQPVESAAANDYGNYGCSSCGPGGCYDPATVQSQMGCCGSVVNAGYYLFADGLFWTREDGEVQLSNFFGVNDFNFVAGGRVTLGYRDNATSGRELTYLGTGDLDESITRSNVAGSLSTLFQAAGGIGFAQISGFFNAVSQTQSKESQIHSIELNRVRWGWDVVKSIAGLRYIYFDDAYSFFSSNSIGTNGLFVMDSVNNLFGGQLGWELFYDVGYRASASLTTKFGGYINAANVDTNLFNGGIQILAQEEDDSAFASSIDVGLLTHYQLNPRARFRLGYDLLFLWGAFTVQNNIPRTTFANGVITGTPTITPNTGTNLNTNNEAVFFHGVSFGFEVFR
jgi:hypothetical protein